MDWVTVKSLKQTPNRNGMNYLTLKRMVKKPDHSLSVNDRAKKFRSWVGRKSVIRNGDVDIIISLTNRSSKGLSGRIIHSIKDVRHNLIELLNAQTVQEFWYQHFFVVRTERSSFTTPQTIVNMFQSWYRRLGLVGCSSHSGSGPSSPKIKKYLVGGSLRDVQMMAKHSSLQPLRDISKVTVKVRGRSWTSLKKDTRSVYGPKFLRQFF